MDADLQNDPADIPKLIAKIDEGFDVVSGWRVKKREPLIRRRLPAYLLNRFIGSMIGIKLHDYGCPLNALTAGVAQQMREYGEMRRFLKPLMVQLATSVAEVPVDHRPRVRGQSRYTFLRLADLCMDFLIGYSTRPFRLVGLAGIGATAVGFLWGMVYLLIRFGLHGPSSVQQQVLVFFLLFFGMQLVIIGLLGEFVIRIYRLVQQRPFFSIEEVLE